MTILRTVADLARLPTGQLVYDRDLETYEKREDGRWAYPSDNPTIVLPANGMLRYGPVQVLESLPPVKRYQANGYVDMHNLPDGSVTLGNHLAQKDGGLWWVAGKRRPWGLKYLVMQENFPVKVLLRGPE